MIFAAEYLGKAVFLGVLLAPSAWAGADSEGWPLNADVKDCDIYDYVIVGSGVSSVVANRLTEDPDVSVLLVEAGPQPTNASRYAGNFPSLVNTDLDWKFKSEPELATQSQSDNAFKYVMGRTLGGSSQINHLLWFRGDPRDFDTWCEIADDPSWCYQSVLPYFLKSEAMMDDEIMAKYGEYHSTKGEIVVIRESSDKTRVYLDSFKEAGHEIKINLNTNETLGYTESTMNHNEVRQSTSEVYLKPIVERPNLFVMYNALATKVNFDGNIAVSVDILVNGKTITVYARSEIILGAGPFNTPKLLMLSGIGPKEHLESLNITVLKDLPVGKNLQDHLVVQIVTKMNASSEGEIKIPPVSEIGFPVIVGAVSIDGLSHPQYQTTNLLFARDDPRLSAVCSVVFGYSDEICTQVVSDTAGRDVMYSFITHVTPKSCGSVALRSTDPLDPPSIKPNFYSNKEDEELVIRFISNFLEVLDTKYFKSVNAEPVLFDGCEGSFADNEFIRCYLQKQTSILFHPTSTCAMGTVVDSKLKVKGFEGLRVVDVSVMPNVPTANTLAPAVMIAEKAADMIKAAGKREACLPKCSPKT